MSNKHLLTTKEVKEILGINWNTLYSYIYEGRLLAYKIGETKGEKSKRHWRIKASDLDAFVNGESHETTTTN